MGAKFVLCGVILMALASGCASVNSGQQPPTVDVTGVWTGLVFGRAATLTLTQVGARVEGQWTIAGYPYASGPVTGDVSGNQLSYATRNGYGADLIVDGIEMIGRGRSGTPVILRRQN